MENDANDKNLIPYCWRSHLL